MSPEVKNSLERLREVQAELKELGLSVICCVGFYTADAAHFSTLVSVPAFTEKAGVSTDHAVLDALREIANNWSDTAHSS